MSILTDHVDIVIGVDPHKDSHTAAFLEAGTGRRLEALTVPAHPAGFADLLTAALRHQGPRCWVIEGCGSWGRSLTSWLQTHGERVQEIDSPRRPPRRMGKKNDELDAERTAREALGRKTLADPRATGHRDALAALLTARRSAAEMATDTERQLLALAITCPQPLADRLRDLKTHKLVTACLRWRPTGDQAVTVTAETMRSMARRVRDLQAEAAVHKKAIERLVTDWRPDLLELTGVGPVIAATVLTVWSHPGRIRNEAAFAMLAGVAPIPASSGKTTRCRLNRRGTVTCVGWPLGRHRDRELVHAFIDALATRTRLRNLARDVS